ncbi:MAG: hypothetical protein HY670_01040, partial [Chloroflexi bacterium]|nr:hypothetical protein [Chloroflexota bacterium]
MNRTFWRLLLSIVTVGVLVFSACTSVSTEDIQGLLQAMEGKEMVITLDDGSTMRVSVADAQKAAAAQQLVGKEVSVKVRAEKAGGKSLDDVKKVGEDQTFTGKIESMGADTWVIGGKTFKVDAKTELDGGLAVGVTARVEFVTQADSSLLAREIETDEQDDDVFKGAVQSISPNAWVIGGQTFKVDAATRIDEGIAVGAMVRVEFVTLPDGSLSAIEIETDQAQDKSQGTIESIAADKFVIGGKTFKVNAATRLDDGLSVGVKARVEFIALADGSMLATEIETDEAEDR